MLYGKNKETPMSTYFLYVHGAVYLPVTSVMNVMGWASRCAVHAKMIRNAAERVSGDEEL